MSAPGLIIAFILVSAFVVYIGWPLIRAAVASGATSGETAAAAGEGAARERARERLTAYYERTLRNLRDLDEDHALGKLEPAAYSADRALWADRGVAVLKAMEMLDAGEGAPAIGGHTLTAETALADIDADIDRAIEQAVAALRAKA